MVEVTEADREAAKKFMQRNLLARPILSNQMEAVLRNAFAAHRTQAAKAERDRLRELPDDVVAKAIANVDKLPRVVTNEEAIRLTAKAIAEALESQP